MWFFILFYLIYLYTLTIFAIIGYFKVPYLFFYSVNFYFINSILFFDHLSILFILLLSFLMPICFFLNIYYPYKYNISIIHRYSFYTFFFRSVKYNNHLIYFIVDSGSILFLYLLLFLYISLLFFFLVSDLFSFYILFESSAISLFFMIGVFGSKLNKIKASYYLIFYTIISSIPFFIMILYLIKFYGSSSIFILYFVKIPFYLQKIFWLFFFFSLAVKIPVFPLHSWLPEAHVEASIEGSVILAGVLLKLGLYGIIRFLLPVFTEASVFYTPFIHMISLLSIFFISCVIFSQLDFKKIIAYSSIIHMNFALLGLFSTNISGVQGSIFLMFSHGFVSSSLFILLGFIYFRYNTRLIFYYQGLLNYYPIFSIFFFLSLLGNFGFPGTAGFIGEFLIILGLFTENIFVGFFSLLSPFFCAIYSLLLYSRIFHGISYNVLNYINLFRSEKFLGILDSLPYLKLHKYLNLKPTLISSEYYILLIFSFYNFYLGLFPKIYLKSTMYTGYFIYFLFNKTLI